MTKRQERELLFKALFMIDFYESEEETLEHAASFLDMETNGSNSELVLNRLKSLISVLPEIDGVINSLAQGWKTSRIAKVDLALLRMAIFEMNYEHQEKGIAINEAVELAKLYGEDRSYAFINGILSNAGE